MSSLDGFAATRNEFALRARLGLLVLLLACELLFLSVRFDTKSLRGASGPVFEILDRAPVFLRLAVTVAAASIGWLVIQKMPVRQLGDPSSAGLSRTAFWLSLHGLSFLAFVAFTKQILEANAAWTRFGWWWLFAWVSTAVTTIGTWSLVLLSGRQGLDILVRCRVILLAGMAIATLTAIGSLGTDQLWNPLGFTTLHGVHAGLRLIDANPMLDVREYTVGTERFHVRIAPSCSGYEGLALVAAFVVVYLLARRESLLFPRSLLLLPMGLAVMWLANVFRLVALIQLGDRWSQEIALGGFHSQAGWLAFNAISLALVFLAERTRFFHRDAVREESTPGVNVTAAYLGPLVAIVATSMATSAFSESFDYLYPLRVFAAAFVLFAFRGTYAGLKLLRGSPAAAMTGLAVAALWIAFDYLSPGKGSVTATPAQFQQMPMWGAVLWMVSRCIGHVLVVPIAEELAFRGYLTRRLIARRFDEVPMGTFSWPAFLVSSVVFGILHGRWGAGTVAGMFFASAMYRRGRLGDAVVAHIVANGSVALSAVATGNWNLWS
ncbi:MAG: exosortase E/protease, VPEID-CTERM system [Planctomycetota bacterium]